MSAPTLRLFEPSAGLREALFLERPNRFVVRADLAGRVVEAHCPNPGRLLEILVPGAELLLQRRAEAPQGRPGSLPRLEYSVVAARRKGILIPLVSTRANDLAEKIILPMLFPQATVVRREYPVGRSRLDFLVELGAAPEPAYMYAFADSGARQLYLEVKGCTLVEEGTAMFPDAPTARGLKHLQELAGLAGRGRAAGVLFVLMNPDAGRFVPNLHTDPAFTGKLISLEHRIWIRAVSVRTGEDGLASVADPDVPIDLEAASAALDDRGAYLLVVAVRRPQSLSAGALGEVLLEPGWYVYAGSGMENLSARIARHHRRRKKPRWHIDYLLDRVEPRDITSLAVRSAHDLECRLARGTARIADGCIRRFGCSDCRCPSHLFHFRENPLRKRLFLGLLLHYRHTVALAPAPPIESGDPWRLE